MLAALVLELGHAAEFAVRHIALHDPAEFGVLTNVGLHEQGADLGVEAHGHEHLGESDRAVPHCCSVVVANRDRMEIDHTEEGVGLVLHLAQFRVAPRKLPRCCSPVGWMPEKTRVMAR